MDRLTFIPVSIDRLTFICPVSSYSLNIYTQSPLTVWPYIPSPQPHCVPFPRHSMTYIQSTVTAWPSVPSLQPRPDLLYPVSSHNLTFSTQSPGTVWHTCIYRLQHDLLYLVSSHSMTQSPATTWPSLPSPQPVFCFILLNIPNIQPKSLYPLELAPPKLTQSPTGAWVFLVWFNSVYTCYIWAVGPDWFVRWSRFSAHLCWLWFIDFFYV